MVYKESVWNHSQIDGNLDRKEERKNQEVMKWESTKGAVPGVKTGAKVDCRLMFLLSNWMSIIQFNIFDAY